MTPLSGSEYVPARAARYLLPRERRVLTVRMHISVIIPPSVVALGGLLAAVAVSPVVRGDGELELTIWLFAILLVAQLVRAVVGWWSTYLVVTPLRCFMCGGSGITSSTPLDEVRDIRIVRPLAGRLLGYGTLVFENARLEVECVPYPEQVYLEVMGVLHPSPDE